MIPGLIINNSNNIVLSIDIAITFIVGIAAVGAVVGFLFSLLGKIGDVKIKELFTRREQDRSKKQNAAHDITYFCIEGIHCGFKHKAGSERHIKFRAAEIESIDHDVGIKLRNFLKAWSMHRNFIKGKPDSVQNDRMAIDYRNTAQKLGDELLVTATEWAK